MLQPILRATVTELRIAVTVHFSKLTDDDLAAAAGNREKREGIIQKRYG